MKELDELTLMRNITEMQLNYEKCMQKSRDFEDLPINAEKYYNQAKVYEYLIECLKNKL